MKTITKILALFIIVSGISTGCKKYEDGPMISLRTKKARLTGDWKVQSVAMNGNDLTGNYQAFMGANYVLDIEKSGSYKTTGNFPDSGTWKLGEDKDDVYFTSSTPGSIEQSFRILRLKSKELWLKQTASNGDITIIKYIPAN